jgi:hypothetical protein
MFHSHPSSPLLSSIEASTHIMLQQWPHLAFHLRSADVSSSQLETLPCLLALFESRMSRHVNMHDVTLCCDLSGHPVLFCVVRRHPIRILLFSQLGYASNLILSSLEQPETSLPQSSRMIAESKPIPRLSARFTVASDPAYFCTVCSDVGFLLVLSI